MQGQTNLTGSTEQPAHKAGFPPFDTKTFPSQIFWLAITFAVLFVVLWRLAGPLIAGTIAARRKRIDDDIAAAQQARTEADAASATYQKALAGARARAQTLAEDNRRRVITDVEKAKADADREAQAALAEAERAIARARTASKEHVTRAAQNAAAEIVQRLIGEAIAPDDSAAAVRAIEAGTKA
jgi:F-type H+-transporting ATPase subunit b